MDMENVSTVQQAFALANTFGQPGQNLMVADKDGNIGWTIAGPIPKRGTAVQNVADFWDSPGAGWQGYLTSDEYPRVYNPSHHRLWTANARVVGDAMLAKVGTGGYALGARQQQIRDGLFALDSADEAAMFALQLDDKAVFLSRWRDLMLEQVLNTQDHPKAHAALLNWSGRAAIDDPGYTLVRHFRVVVREMVFEQLANALMATDADFRLWTVWHHFEEPLWQMMTHQPQHLLPDGYANWQDLLTQAWQKTHDDLTESQTQPIQKWGDYNTTNIRHPLSRAVPLLGSLTDMPKQAQAGDSYMPLVASPTHGSSQRMVVAPGQEARGIMQMPSSQSGHPLSPFYGKGHDEWLNGVATPFLGGKGQYELILQPAS
jgi:penicillin amidase